MQSFTGKNKSILSVTLAVGVLVGMLGWSNAVQAEQPRANRFVVLPPGDWVLDTNTRLRWQQYPTASANLWGNAAAQCGAGSRLPEVWELQSLVDYNVANQATSMNISNGPFEGVLDNIPYWSATENARFSFTAWTVRFFRGEVNALDKTQSNALPIWCVR